MALNWSGRTDAKTWGEATRPALAHSWPWVKDIVMDEYVRVRWIDGRWQMTDERLSHNDYHAMIGQGA